MKKVIEDGVAIIVVLSFFVFLIWVYFHSFPIFLFIICLLLLCYLTSFFAPSPVDSASTKPRPFAVNSASTKPLPFPVNSASTKPLLFPVNSASTKPLPFPVNSASTSPLPVPVNSASTEPLPSPELMSSTVDSASTKPLPSPANSASTKPLPSPANPASTKPLPSLEPMSSPADSTSTEPLPSPANYSSTELMSSTVDSASTKPLPSPANSASTNPLPSLEPMSSPADSTSTEPLPSPANSSSTEPLPFPTDSVSTEPLPSPADSSSTEPLPSPADSASIKPLHLSPDSIRAGRALSSVLSAVSSAPVASRKYDLVRSLADQILDRNLSSGVEELLELNRAALAVAFARTIALLEVAIEVEVRLASGLLPSWAAQAKDKQRGASAEKLAAETMWLGQKMAENRAASKAVTMWGSMLRLPVLAISVQWSLRELIVRVCEFMLTLVSSEELEGNSTSSGLAMLKAWLPLLRQFGKKSDTVRILEKIIEKFTHEEQEDIILSVEMLKAWLPLLCQLGKKADTIRILERMIEKFTHEEQGDILSIWLRHYTSCSDYHCLDLESCYMRWYSES